VIDTHGHMEKVKVKVRHLSCQLPAIVWSQTGSSGHITLRYPARELVAEQPASWSQTCSRASRE